ncbi:MAG TPA: pitrilysin family protein, partial [Pyrinomonadaceae bacterium]
MKYLNPLKLRTIAATLVAFAFIASAVAPLRAQQPPAQDKGTSRSKVERKNRAPVSKEVLRVKLPKAVEVVLDNGLTVMILEDHRFPVVNMNLQMSGAGPIFDPADKPGLANLTSQMLREGTKTRNSRQIAEEIDKLGATLGANSGFGSTAASVNASGLSDNFDQWFGLMADMLMNPSFPADEFGKLKARQKTALMQQRTQPGFLSQERFRRVVYGNHPAAVFSTTPAVLDSLTPEMLAAWHRERYVPQNAVLGIAGDVKASEVIAKLKT